MEDTGVPSRLPATRSRTRSRRHWSDGLSAVLVLGTVAGLPWAFGGVEAWAWGLAVTLLGLGLAAWFGFGDGAARVASNRPAWVFPALALLAWMGIQLVPLPVGALRSVSPQAYRWLSEDLPGFGRSKSVSMREEIEKAGLGRLPTDLPRSPAPVPGQVEITSDRLGVRTWPISLVPGATFDCLVWGLALLGAAAYLAARSAESEFRERVRAVLFADFTLLAVVGFVQKASWNGAVLWFRAVQDARPFGPYVNGDHFAGAMEIGVPWMAAFSIARLRSAEGPRARVVGVAAAVAATLCLGAAVAAQSKMATVLILAGLGVLATIHIGSRRPRLLLGLGLSVGLAVAAALGATGLGGRFRDFFVANASDIGGYERIVAWRSFLPWLRDFVLTGSGFGSFRFLSARYIPGGDGYAWTHAHNDWLEFALEGGAIGALLLAVLIATYVRTIVRSRAAQVGRATMIECDGLLIGLASLAIHAFVDFNHHIPANALLFAAAAAVASPWYPTSRGEPS